MKLGNGMTITFIPNLSAQFNESQLPRIKKWIEVLRTNEYKQGQNQLRDEDRFCCLGVFCDLNKADWGGTWVKGEDGYEFSAKGLLDTFLIPYEYKLLSGLPAEVGFDVNIDADDYPKGASISLSILNDKGATFAEIANIIEVAINGGYRVSQ